MSFRFVIFFTLFPPTIHDKYSIEQPLKHFFEGRFFSEGHFDHFYGSHGNKSTHHAKEN